MQTAVTGGGLSTPSWRLKLMKDVGLGEMGGGGESAKLFSTP